MRVRCAWDFRRVALPRDRGALREANYDYDKHDDDDHYDEHYDHKYHDGRTNNNHNYDDNDKHDNHNHDPRAMRLDLPRRVRAKRR